MAYSSRTLPSHLRKSTTGNSYGSSSGQSPALVARINEKRKELAGLRELRDLSAGLAGQMSVLEEKLATLSDGTEGIYLDRHSQIYCANPNISRCPSSKQLA